MDMQFPRALRHLLLAAAMAALAACGGGGGSGTPDVSTGVLTDAPIQGVEYLTSGNLGGSTNASGQFSYHPGETIVFKLGLLPLGVVTGSGSTMTVTPLQLVEGFTAITDPVEQQHAVTNLLVLLQSLDTDPDPARIVIAPAAITALQDTARVDALTTLLTDTPANFAGSTAFTSLLTLAGTTAVSDTTALAHFKAQFLADLAGQYYGVVNGNFRAYRFLNDGSYLMTEIASPDAGGGPLFQKGGQPGLERGVVTWDPSNGQVSASTNLDTNGSRGFSSLDPVNAPLRLTLDGGDLILTSYTLQTGSSGSQLVKGATNRLTRLPDSATGAGGTWVKDTPTSLATPVFFFLPNNTYLLLDPVGDTSFHYASAPLSSCYSTGVEMGGYEILGGMLQFLGPSFDSNGCAGVHDTSDGSNFIQAQYLDAGAGTWQWGPADASGQHLYRADNIAP